MRLSFYRMKLIHMKILLYMAFGFVLSTETEQVPKNIVLIVADDLGWDDVSFHGSNQTLTPNIDLLAYSGVALGRYYSHCICTPSRSALLTGKYSHTIGMQGYPLTNSEDRGLPVTEKLLPQYLKDLGYATHLVGKWHVGQSRTEYLPTMRGFDSHFGHRGGFVDYYEYELQETWSTGDVTGFGLFRNLTPAWDVEGYLTDIYTCEAKSVISNHDQDSPLFLMVGHNAPHCANAGARLQAPAEEVRAMRHVESSNRRIFSAMVKKLDDSVGEIVEALANKGILENTVIVFIADNGGMTSGLTMNYASNWPLRGLKMSPYEGGVRVAGLLWTADYNNSNHLWNGYMHVTDWLPTLLKAAGAEIPVGIDGIDLWDNINSNEDSDRQVMFEIDDYTGFSTMISGDYKLVTGNIEKAYSDYQGGDLRGIIGDGVVYEDAIKNSTMYSILNQLGKQFTLEDVKLRNDLRIDCSNATHENICYPQNGTYCLFNIKEDPCETQDLSKTYPDMVESLYALLQVEMSRTIPRVVPFYRNPLSSPRLNNYSWDVWADNLDE